MNSKYREFYLNFITSKKKPFSSIMIKIYQAELVVRDCLLCKNFLIGFLTQQGHVISLKSYRYVCTCSTNALFSLLICPCITLTLLHSNFFFSHTFSMKVKHYTFYLFKYIVGPYTYNLCLATILHIGCNR